MPKFLSLKFEIKIYHIIQILSSKIIWSSKGKHFFILAGSKKCFYILSVVKGGNVTSTYGMDKHEFKALLRWQSIGSHSDVTMLESH
jgi:hypothetical protein